MIDKGKAIKGLEKLRKDLGYGLPDRSNVVVEYLNSLTGAIELLKEREAVKPVNVRWEMGINGGNCPKCMNWVQRSFNFCPFCGKAVKWE